MPVTVYHEPKVDTFLLAEAVTPSDTVSFAVEANGWYVGTGGNVAVLLANGLTETFVAMPTGSVMQLRIRRINATGTTASNLVALY